MVEEMVMEKIGTKAKEQETNTDHQGLSERPLT